MGKISLTTIVFFCLLSLTPAFAGVPKVTGYDSGNVTVEKSYNYRTTSLNSSFEPAQTKESRVLEVGYEVHVDYVFKWKLSILMGEPVVIGLLAYKPSFIQLFGPLQLSSSVSKNKDLFKRIRVTDFKMAVQMFVKPQGRRAQDRGAGLIIDAGSAGRPYIGHSSADLVENGTLFEKFQSFNTPGSPDWNKLFGNINTKQEARQYFLKLVASASKRDRYYPSYYIHSIVKVDLDTSAVDKYIYDYLSGLEKDIREKEKAKELVTEQTDALEAALAETEEDEGGESDFLADDGIDLGSESLADMLEQTEKVKLIFYGVPRTTTSNVITISGKVENASAIDSSEIVFHINGLEQPVDLAANGSFSNKIVLFNGENRIDVNYSSVGNDESKRFMVKSSTPPVKARFTLVWDRAGSDMDLHLNGPQGGHCYYSEKATKNMRLDVDNTSGYGPENISVKLNQQAGLYNVSVKHFSGNASSVTLYVYLDNRLVATKTAYVSGGQKWHAYSLDID